MDKKKLFFNLLYVILIVAVVLFLVWFVGWIKSESAMCLKDPIQYYSNKTAQMCYCNNGLGWLKLKP